MEFGLGATTAGTGMLATLKWDRVGELFSSPGPRGLALQAAALLLLFLSGTALWAVLLGQRRSRKESELKDRYRGMIEETSDIIHIVSPEGKFLYVNGGWRKTLGYKDDEIARLTLMDLLHPEEREKAKSQIKELMDGRPVIDIETRFVTKDGRTIWVEGNSTCELARGRVVSRRGIFHNVTERKQGEAERARLMASGRSARLYR